MKYKQEMEGKLAEHSLRTLEYTLCDRVVSAEAREVDFPIPGLHSLCYLWANWLW